MNSNIIEIFVLNTWEYSHLWKNTWDYLLEIALKKEMLILIYRTINTEQHQQLS